MMIGVVADEWAKKAIKVLVAVFVINVWVIAALFDVLVELTIDAVYSTIRSEVLITAP